MEDWEGFVWWMTRGGFYRSQMGKSSLSVPNTFKKKCGFKNLYIKSKRGAHFIPVFSHLDFHRASSI